MLDEWERSEVVKHELEVGVKATPPHPTTSGLVRGRVRGSGRVGHCGRMEYVKHLLTSVALGIFLYSGAKRRGAQMLAVRGLHRRTRAAFVEVVQCGIARSTSTSTQGKAWCLVRRRGV